MNAQRSDALLQALADFDGKSTAPLEAFAAAQAPDAQLIAALCDFAASDAHDMQAAATLLLKRFAVTGAQLTDEQTASLLRLLMRESAWLCRLHILQIMHTLLVPATLAQQLMDALTSQARDAKAFIRAWSVHGAVAIADQHPACRERACELLAAAEQDQAASVKARVRNLRAATDWLR